MCTAISFSTDSHYFGRTLDLEYNYDEQVVITPRNFCLNFKHTEPLPKHFAIIGTAFVSENYPLYYDGVNEKGLAMAGLNFDGYARFNGVDKTKENIATFELIPYILGNFSKVSDVKEALKNINITDTDFSCDLKSAPLHWIVADKNESVTVEQTKEGLRVYDNKVGVLTNNPEFSYHITNLNNYINQTAEIPDNRFSDRVDLTVFSKGMGAIGIPGDFSSVSRFVRATFLKLNQQTPKGEMCGVTNFFHIMENVSVPRGCVRLGDDKCQITVYTSCMNCDKGIYYYTTYNNRKITAVDMNKENLDSHKLIAYNHITTQQIGFQN